MRQPATAMSSQHCIRAWALATLICIAGCTKDPQEQHTDPATKNQRPASSTVEPPWSAPIASPASDSVSTSWRPGRALAYKTKKYRL